MRIKNQVLSKPGETLANCSTRRSPSDLLCKPQVWRTSSQGSGRVKTDMNRCASALNLTRKSMMVYASPMVVPAFSTGLCTTAAGISLSAYRCSLLATARRGGNSAVRSDVEWERALCTERSDAALEFWCKNSRWSACQSQKGRFDHSVVRVRLWC